MSEKCICNLFGHPLKDTKARNDIELLKQGGSGGKTYYKHNIKILRNDEPFSYIFSLISSSSTPITTPEQLRESVGEYGVLVGISPYDFCTYVYYDNLVYLYNNEYETHLPLPIMTECPFFEGIEDTVTEL